MEKISPKGTAKPVTPKERSGLALIPKGHQAPRPVVANDNGEGPARDVDMADPSEFDEEEESDRSTVYSDDNSSYFSESEIETEGDDGPPEVEDRPFTNQVNMGEIIEFAYRRDMDYDDDEVNDVFNDGLSGDDDSVYDSDVSSNYEELTEPDLRVVERIVSVPIEENVHSAEEESEGDDTYNDEDTDMEDDVKSESSAIAAVPDDISGAGLQNVEPSPEPRTIDQLQQDDIILQRLTKDRDLANWKVHELQEAIRRLEAEIPIAQKNLDDTEEIVLNKEKSMFGLLERSGLTPELYEEYKAFCESLQPEFGLRDGFSITCDQPHQGSYILYDPEFAIFKREVELDYNSFNWRCEASVSSWFRSTEQVVEFWPLKPREAFGSGNQSWGRLYPDLYRLLNDAARNGSEAAKDILIRIPDINASFTGGWMFDYQFEPLLKDEAVISHRWVLRGSHLLGPRYEGNS